MAVPVAETLQSWGLAAYVDKVVDEGFTTIEELFDLTDDEIKNELGFTKLADRRKLTTRLNALKNGSAITTSSPSLPSAATPPASSSPEKEDISPSSPSLSTSSSSSSSSGSSSPIPAVLSSTGSSDSISATPATPFRDPFTLPATKDLIARLQRKEVVLLVGSGLSIASTFQPGQSPPFPKALSWLGLLQHGVQYACQLKGPEEATEFSGRINKMLDAGEFISAASSLCEFLQKEVDAKHFEYFLREAFDPIVPTNERLTQVLRGLVRDCAIRVTTTNYDNLLEDQLGIPPLHYSDHNSEIDDWIRGRSQKVFHWHGHYRRPSDVILDTSHYQRIVRENKHVQAAMGGMAVTKTFLFLGCGSSGLSDPNWGKLMQRMHDIGLSDRFALCTTGELPQFAQLKGLIAIPYGTSHGDLVPFLYKLYEQTLGATLDQASSPALDRSLPSASPVFSRPESELPLSSSSTSSVSAFASPFPPASSSSPSVAPGSPAMSASAPAPVATAVSRLPPVRCPNGHVTQRRANMYRSGGWVCDHCRVSALDAVEREVCVACSADLCDTCAPQFANPKRLRCTGGHLLYLSNNFSGNYATGFVCNCCRSHQQTWRYHCPTCTDDFCVDCYAKFSPGSQPWKLSFSAPGSASSSFFAVIHWSETDLTLGTPVPFHDKYGDGVIIVQTSSPHLLFRKSYINCNSNATFYYRGPGSWLSGEFRGSVACDTAATRLVGSFVLTRIPPLDYPEF